MDENKKNFLLNEFFKNEDFAGWQDIAESLICNGYCIIAGSKSLWSGGVGNFIEISEAKEYVDCVRLDFDLQKFTSTNYFKERLSVRIMSFTNEKRELDAKLESLQTF